jgi:hypothetical protein
MNDSRWGEEEEGFFSLETIASESLDLPLDLLSNEPSHDVLFVLLLHSSGSAGPSTDFRFFGGILPK